jgi:hypothetical protein
VGVTKQLVALEKKKSFLGEFCASVLCQLLEVCPKEMCGGDLVCELGVAEGWEGCTAERLLVLLHLSKLYGKVCVMRAWHKVGVTGVVIALRLSGSPSFSRSIGIPGRSGVLRTLHS